MWPCGIYLCLTNNIFGTQSAPSVSLRAFPMSMVPTFSVRHSIFPTTYPSNPIFGFGNFCNLWLKKIRTWSFLWIQSCGTLVLFVGSCSLPPDQLCFQKSKMFDIMSCILQFCDLSSTGNQKTLERSSQVSGETGQGNNPLTLLSGRDLKS